MKWGVLLVNSGTPASLATRDVRAFLAGLLGDPRVVELPRVLWWPILHGIILRIRPRASAKKYAAIWTPEGSPLAIESEALRRGLEAFLRPHDTPVALAMLYTGGASVPEAIASLRKAGAEGILTIPMFPQYCGASTGAVFDQVSAALRGLRSVPSLRFVSSYHDDAAYIDALAASVQDHRRSFGRHGPSAHVVSRRTRALRRRWEILTAINANERPAWWRRDSGSPPASGACPSSRASDVRAGFSRIPAKCSRPCRRAA